ncbi:MAG: hypothetical protein JOZ04_12345 [Acidimicrobiia bacterium]|nr:hypothetical protein [Acidimicrobiia bacterium]
MEDRLDAGLWLKAADAVDTGQALTWWENASPGRTDLPRRLDEFQFLGIREVGADFHAADGWHFRRYPRPGQGVLSGGPTLGLLVVLVGLKEPDQAQAFRDWADFTHIHHIAASDDSDGLMITPYENVTGADPRFLHLYELSTPDPERWFTGMPDRVARHLGGGPGTPAFDAWAWHPALRILYVNTFRRVDG